MSTTSDRTFVSSPADVEKFDAEIKRLLMADPFRPFDVVVASGIRYPAPHRMCIAIGERGMVPAYRPSKAPPMFRKDQIVAVDVLGTDSH